MADSQPIKSQDVIVDGVFNPTIQNTDQLIKKLKELETEFGNVLSEQEKILKQSKKGVSTADDINKVTVAVEKSKTARQGLNEVQKQQEQLQKQLKNSTDAEVKAKIRFQQATKKQKDELRDLLILEDAEAGTLQKLQAENRKLRRERESLNLETAKGRARLTEINAQLDVNNKKIISNSDQLKKQRLNVGNYSNSIKDAVNQSGLFSRQLATLQRIQATLNALTKKNTVETEANAVAQATAGKASGGFSKALKVLKTALISTGIGAIVVALGSLVAAFSSTQRGADAFTKVLRPLQAIFERFVGFLQNKSFQVFDRLKAAFEDPKQAVIDLADAIKNNLIKRFESIGVFGSAIAKLFNGQFKEGFTELGNASVQLATGVENASEKITNLATNIKDTVDTAVDEGSRLAELLILFEERQIELEVPLAKARLEFQKLREIAQDQTKNDEERIKALKEAENIQRFIADGQKELLDLQIERLELEQSLNDTSREQELELEKLKARRFEAESAAQKKINGLVSLRTGIEKRIETQRQKEIDDLNKINDLLQDNNKEREKTTDIQDEVINKQAEERRLAQERAEFSADVEKKIAEDQLKSEQAIQDARLDSANQLLEITQLVATENEKLQKSIIAAQKALALGEIIINSEREISQINADTDATQEEKRARTVAATARALASAAKVVAVSGSAYDGTEDTGTGSNVDNKGGMYWILHPHERVMTAKQNALVGDMSNEHLAELAYNYRTGNLINDTTLKPTKDIGNDNKKVIEAIHNLTNKIEKKPVQQVNLDKLGNVYETIYKDGYKQTIKYKFNKKRI